MCNFSWDIPWVQRRLKLQSNYRRKITKQFIRNCLMTFYKALCYEHRVGTYYCWSRLKKLYGKREVWINQALESGVVRIWYKRGVRTFYLFNSSLVRAPVWWAGHSKYFISQQDMYRTHCNTRKIRSARRYCQGLLHVRVKDFLFLFFLSFSFSSFISSLLCFFLVKDL